MVNARLPACPAAKRGVPGLFRATGVHGGQVRGAGLPAQLGCLEKASKGCIAGTKEHEPVDEAGGFAPVDDFRSA